MIQVLSGFSMRREQTVLLPSERNLKKDILTAKRASSRVLLLSKEADISYTTISIFFYGIAENKSLKSLKSLLI